MQVFLRTPRPGAGRSRYSCRRCNEHTPMTGTARYLQVLEKLKGHVLPATSVLIVTHDFPDPDCISAAFGMRHLLSHWGIDSSMISFGGFVGRAENRSMIRLLNIDAIPLMLAELDDYDRTVIVDSVPGIGNLSLPPERKIDAVIDHHPHEPPTNPDFFCDIRDDLGATSTLVTKYLLAAGYSISSHLATALFYGIKTDTRDMARNASAEDLECYRILFDLMDHRVLASIESPDRDAEYFRVLHRATEAMVTFDEVGYTHLGAVSTPDYLAEMADLFHSLETLEWMVCSGIFKKQIFFSIRSRNENAAGTNARRIAETLNGSGGGHSTMAAGRIPLSASSTDQSVAAFVRTIKDVFGVADQEGKTILDRA